ncbi:RluA family pseudouridine synthase [Myxococcus sp. MISCRS1]|uniref:RluA family pseudouridine synthase n=1 Tax=Myxococcus TaxID=32 RepID=UPI001144EAC4|nr:MULTISPECIES: RluA family pseudouridine synthase [unclassified Myxococcus]MBZ4396935.1 RluA family pseudouridine synthase [Myxococcus sp. AS-1-15]MBZ4408339.1 RluA family pseudouridine synthase [Myxococcus sp. XM-1-1-1]MCK8496283.1 RluA family pseudouridine synthase [Myxococcus fulvus]BDT33437.1 RluA family pseudouridine synthase [Myxococcus sp. MH1]MCY0996545.1 RluA family pseudouridine synthase [Myxococcus sp. MISCRS1]
MSTSQLHTFTVAADKAGQRVDLFVGEALSLSRARLKRLFESGAVKVNGRAAKKGLTLVEGQAVAVVLEEETREAVPDQDFPLTVLHEDAELVFVDKPAGRPSHPLQSGETGTVANALVARYPECAQASVDPREGGLCHRLDVETSGVVVAARTRAAWNTVREAFGERAVDKRYLALVTGPLVDEGDIELPLRHHPRHPDRVEPAPYGAEDAREAVSRFRVLSRAGEHSVVEVRILTGVLHQVRAHLAGIGAPIVGDTLYGGREAPELGRFFLHARALGLSHPVTKKPLHVTSPLPPELRAELERLGLPLPRGEHGDASVSSPAT